MTSKNDSGEINLTPQEKERIKEFAMDKKGAYKRKSWTMPQAPWKRENPNEQSTDSGD